MPEPVRMGKIDGRWEAMVRWSTGRRIGTVEQDDIRQF